MGVEVFGVARYRFAATLRRTWGGYAAIVVLLGVIGGTALGSLVAARETSSSYATFLARTNPSDMNVTLQAPNITARLSQLPGVRHVETALYSLNAFPLKPNGAPLLTKPYLTGKVAPMASVDGEFFSQDRVAVVAGRLADPRRADEFVADATAERAMGWHVGQSVRFGFFTNAQTASPSFGAPGLTPAVVRTEHLVGTIVYGYAVLQDAVDRTTSWLLFTPAAARAVDSGVQYEQYALQLDGGANGVTRVEREIIDALPAGTTYNFHVTSVVTGQVVRAVRPEALALGIFGVLALLGAVLTAAQLISRHLRSRREDQEVLRALGVTRSAIVVDALAGVLVAVLVGSLLAVAVAVFLSPLSPIGPVRSVLAGRLHLDVGVVAGGAACLLVGSAVAAVALAYLWAPGHHGRPARLSNGSALARAGAAAGLATSAVAGLHFAFESGRGRNTVPVRSVLVGVVLSVAMIGATLTFGSGLATLISHPALYGWNWDYAVTSNQDVPPQSLTALTRSPLVRAWSGVNFANAQINGVTVPIILVGPHAAVSAPLLAGHEVDNVHQVVLGAATLAQLHAHVGGTVTVSYGTKRDYPVYVPPTRATVVGAATLPAVGAALTLHPSMGVGAEIDINIEPRPFRAAIASPYRAMNGPNLVMVRLRPGVTRAQLGAVERTVERVSERAFHAVPNGLGGGAEVTWLSVQYPAEIVNYRSMGDVPLVLAMGFTSGVVAAFALTVVTSVRRRRRDLALLKTLGFTRRQLSSAIAWQATVTVVSGLLVGIPLGIVLGRWLWDLFAAQIYAVPRATVPTLSLVVVAVSAVTLANLVAFFPSRAAANTRAALALRAE